MLGRVVLGLWVAIGLATGGCLVEPKPSLSANDISVRYPLRQLRLANGMLVLLERAPDFGTAGVALVVGSGAAAEAPAKAGLAHLTEHLAFQGNPAGQVVWKRLLDLGIQANAFTSWDETTFVAVDLTSQLDSLLAFGHSLVSDPLVDVAPNEFLREQKVVTGEMRLRTESGTPQQAMGRLMSAAFPKGHPYGHSVAGTRDTIAALTLDDVRAFAADHYRPGNSTLVVSAPIDLDDLQARVAQVLGDKLIPAPAQAARPRSHSGVAALQTPPRSFETREADVPSPVLWIGWSVPAAAVSERLAPLVEDAFDTKLFVDLELRDPDIAHASAGLMRGMDAALFYVLVYLKNASHPEATIHSVVTELEGSLSWLAQGTVADAMKRTLATGATYGQEGMYHRVADLAWSYHHTGRPLYSQELGQQILTSSTAESTRYAHDFLTEARSHAVLEQPLGDASEGARRASAPLANSQPGTSGVQGAAVPAALDVNAANGRKDPLAPAAPTSIGPGRRMLANLKSVQMSNGLQVLILPRPASPFHTALLAFKGGYAEADPGGVTKAATWARRSERYFGDLSAAALSLRHRHAVYAGATVDIMRGTGSDLGPTLDELGHIVGLATFWPPRQFTLLLDVFEREEHAPEALFDRAMARAFYGTHPLASLPTVAEVARIPPVMVQKWVDRTRRPENGLLIVVGDVDADEVVREIKASPLGRWGEGQGPARVGPPHPPPRLEEMDPASVGQVVVQHQPGSLQAKLAFHCLLPPTSADALAARAVFAHRFNRKMGEQLREEMGASYSVRGRARTLPGGTSVFDLSADISYAQLPDALWRLRTLLGGWANGAGDEGLDPATDRFMSAVGEQWRLEVPTTYEIADNLLGMWIVDWPFDTMDRLPDQVKAVRSDAVRAIAQHCATNWVVGLLGEESRLRRAWARSGEPTSPASSAAH